MPSRGVALVAGAGGSIGAATAELLAARGMDVALVAQDREHLAAIAQRCAGHGVRAAPMSLDRADTAALPDLIARIGARLGRLDALVCIAERSVRGALQAVDLAQWDALLSTDLRGIVHLTHAALPLLLAAPAPAIITIVSAGTGQGSACSAPALLGFTRALFEDVRARGVKVCAVRHGRVGLAPSIRPADIAEAVAFVLDFPAGACPTEITVRSLRA